MKKGCKLFGSRYRYSVNYINNCIHVIKWDAGAWVQNRPAKEWAADILKVEFSLFESWPTL